MKSDLNSGYGQVKCFLSIPDFRSGSYSLGMFPLLKIIRFPDTYPEKATRDSAPWLSRVFFLSSFIAVFLPAVTAVQVSGQDLIINEFMALNESILEDEDGDFSDWIEIYNASSNPVLLENWFLTDDPDDLKKWDFPELALPANQYLLVFASGKNRNNVEGFLHVNFRLDSDGEYLALVRPDGLTIEHEYLPEKQFIDVSFGISDPQDATLSRHLFSATPGESNESLLPERTGPPGFSKEGGTFLLPFQLELTTELEGAFVRYTLDQSIPNENSTIFNRPVSINRTTQIRARVYKSGLPPGPIVTRTFQFLGPDVRNFSSNLPVVVVDLFGARTVSGNSPRTAYMAIYEPGEGRTDLKSVPNLESRIGIRVRGSSSTNRPKQSYAVESWDEFDDDRDIGPLGMPEDSDWILYGPYNFDRALVRNPFVYEQSNQIGRYAVRTRFVELFLNNEDGILENEDYHGVYVWMEKIKRHSDRVDVERLLPEHRDEPEISGGYIVKIDRLDPGDSGFNGGRQLMAFVYPKEENITRSQRNWLRGYFDEFNRALRSVQFTDPENGYAKFIDVDSWIDHHIINEFTKNPDAFRLSAYMFIRRNGLIETGPAWDFDRTLGPDDDARAANPVGWSSAFYFGWWSRLFNDPNFWQRYVDRWTEVRQGVYSTENMFEIIDSMRGELTEASKRNFNRWSGLIGGRGWGAEINQLKSWVERRGDWMDSQFPIPPVIAEDSAVVQSGFTVNISADSVNGFYTLDGSDPRLCLGAVASGAVRYQNQAIRLTRSAKVVSRVQGGKYWSAPVERTFLVTGLDYPLVISEIMYHPQNGTAFEYLEILNTGQKTVPLGGLLFEGIDYQFPFGSILRSGEVLVLASNNDPEAFQSANPAVVVFDYFKGSLDNAGELLILKDAGDFVISSVEYDDEGEWPVAADGLGGSLELVDSSGELNDPANWRVSAVSGGTPGVGINGSAIIDSDRDGIPDSWEVEHGLNPALALDALEDLDGDGFTNLEEFLEGTDPNVSARSLRLSGLLNADGSVSLKFQASAGKSYVVQFKNDSLSNPWKTFKFFTPIELDQLHQFQDQLPANVSIRFYRILVPHISP